MKSYPMTAACDAERATKDEDETEQTTLAAPELD
jgi:hypothetical protein